MAQASMAPMPVATGAALQPSTVLSEDEIRQIQEYDRVVQFRDAVLSGSHPHIKPPAQSGATKAQSNLQTSSSLGGSNGEASVLLKSAPVYDYRLDNAQSFKANSQQSAIATPATGGLVNFAKGAVAGATQFDPLLLTKSDVLVRAELQQQRQRIEKTLREELEHRRTASKTTQPAEQEADLDLPDILAKALTLVQATAPPADAELAANSSDSSDSFDNNTFYSSQHDTPEPFLSSPRAHHASEDVPMQETTTSAPRIRVHAEHSRPANSQPAAKTSTSFTASNDVARPNRLVQSTQPYIGPSDAASFAGLVLQRQAPVVYSQYGAGILSDSRMEDGDQVQPMVISSNGSGSTSRSDDRHDVDERTGPKQHRQADLVAQREPPFIRSHDLQPYAPQPAHVSPLATSRQPPMPDPEISILPGAPPQVAALRQEAGNGTSPESSPQGEKGNKKKNKKKNKRKVAPERPVSPLIKPEPRSPSPLSAPQYSRPAKRQRPSQRQQELNYDEPRRQQSVEVIHDEYDSRVAREERMPTAVGYERVVEDAYGRHMRQPTVMSSQRMDLPVYEDRRLDEPIQYIRRAPEPLAYAVPYAASEARPMRSASYSVSVADTPYREPIAYYPEGRMSVRPATDRARSRSPARAESRAATTMGPPRPPTRLVRDRFGREYIEPPPMRSVSRLSAAPPGRAVEHEVIYERLPAPGTFEQDGIIYRRASPVSAQRRVVPQPDYGAVDYRGYRQRDYSMHSVPPVPGHEYVQYRSTEERRLPAEASQEYTMRSNSVRPQEPVQYEYPRVQSIRPSEVPVREYAASIHPESRREAAPPTYREYSARPTELEMPRREYSVRPMERYYERPVLRDDEVTYMEPPRTVQREVVYEDGRREVYR